MICCEVRYNYSVNYALKSIARKLQSVVTTAVYSISHNSCCDVDE